MIDRRSILGGAVLGAGAFGIAAFTGRDLLTGRNATLASATARSQLRIPPLYSGERKSGERVFDLNLRHGVSRFFEGIETPTIGINQSYLGPTLELNAGDTVRMNVTSDLPETATVHWHGFHLPARADGGPHQPIGPGGSWTARFDVRQRASMFWYHSHAHRRSGPQVYQGLAGMIYVRDNASEALDLPNDYGVDDIPLIVQDRAFASDGSFIYSTRMHNVMMGMMGDTMLVNGVVEPVFEARSDRLRLRLVNGSNARFYRFGFDDGRSFHQIGTDGGFLAAPLPTDNVVLAPGERAQVIVDVSDGRPVSLLADGLEIMGMGNMGRGMRGSGRMRESDGPMGNWMMGERGGRNGMMGERERRDGMMGGMMDERRQFTVLDIRPAEGRTKAIVMPRRLATLPRIDPGDAVRTRRFVLDMGMGMRMMREGGFTINGKSMDMQRIDETVRVNTTEIWQVENASMMAHPFHIHDVQFRILDRNGRAPDAAEQGLKDTVVVYPGETVRLLLRFEDYTDADLPYMYHCHILEHEDAGMMGQFTVTV
ncbi:multicopper oxidase domain-containing protein [Alteriqipengyuania flavescens]|uniref:multicopper oxidase family protein n=1 Tax=Alteriqipengyuania flavescens TaxID=3053610 RepID=UPI0025B3861F|nr:multicopper oxidase domain-containing protein [Alteriqipengyuania flavescens]WJY17791.1 multicopper oxidase domain-containing protein [Alteriqipengyuania flavescens]WJY23733.1 multicopper oxidase domain-containing protein [Alteriqipengyuania flavescens]